MNPPSSFDAMLVGQRWSSPGRTLTEADLTMSCMTSTDWHPIHADQEFAKETPLGRRMFHGTFCMHLAFGMASHQPGLSCFVVAALGFSEWRFLKPVLVGDTLHIEAEVISKRATSDGKRGILERRICLFNQNHDAVQEGKTSMLANLTGHLA
jgi:acyl dehydratase